MHGDWHTVRKLLPYLWEWRWRIALALSFLVAAKLANVGVPLVLKRLIDTLDVDDAARAALVVPVALLLAYGEGKWTIDKRHIQVAAADTPAAEPPARGWWRLGLGRAA